MKYHAKDFHVHMVDLMLLLIVCILVICWYSSHCFIGKELVIELLLLILKNSSWYKDLTITDFFCGVGRHIRVGEMLSRTSVKSRMESGAGINFAEFSYQAFQSYDWLHLFKNYNCRFQIGGSDQLGNIVSGYNLISGCQYQHVYGCLLPLIQSESGDKFGKSAGNAVYISQQRTSFFDFYQFFLRLPDAGIDKYLKLFTFLSLNEIEDIIQNHMKNPDARRAQRILAEEVTLLVHGEQGLALAETATKVLYQSDLAALAKLNIEELRLIFPSSTVSYIPYEPGISFLDLSMKVGCFISEGDAKRIISSGGLYINFTKISSPSAVIVPDIHILPNKNIIN
ncbi:tyrosine--tRNA ligase, mitochondrial-like [Uloborus diversus]|uniref:tyrosine--tRNA ligase, mitochondrial-like n=1 Tax=Uloborus diversus TaxID=327109 RepID=UPI00240984FF|nr:tyrosine--tRNA ligase, mitochondrial-like [Uloborus diversus]